MTNEELLDALIALVDDGSGRPPLEMARDRLARPEAALIPWRYIDDDFLAKINDSRYSSEWVGIALRWQINAGQKVER